MEKFEYQNSKFETNPKFKCSNDSNTSYSKVCSFESVLVLVKTGIGFRASDFVSSDSFGLVLKCFCYLVGYKLRVAPHGK